MRKKTITSFSSPHSGAGRIPQRLFLLLVLCLFSTLPILAHEQKTAVTRILFNDRTGNVEVMHRFLVHDAEHAASMIFGEGQSLLESEDSRELFSSYVVNRFAIELIGPDEVIEPVSLNFVGAEVDGQFMWVYQEFEMPGSLTGLTVVNMALRDVWPDQSNLVNIERGGEILSLTFVEGSQILSVEF